MGSQPHVRKGALGEAERDLWTQETGEDRREAGSETKPEENARKAQPQTRKHRRQQPPEPSAEACAARPCLAHLHSCA